MNTSQICKTFKLFHLNIIVNVSWVLKIMVINIQGCFDAKYIPDFPTFGTKYDINVYDMIFIEISRKMARRLTKRL